MILWYNLCFLGLVSSIIQLSDVSTDFAMVDLTNVIERIPRHRRQTDEENPCDLKDTLSLPITYKKNKKVLQLVRDKNKSPENVPVLKMDANGNLKVSKKKKKNVISAIYHYYENLYRFGIMVTCKFSKECDSDCQIRGDLLTDDELIEIAGSANDKDDIESQLLDEVPHVVKQLPGSDYTNVEIPDTRTPGLDRNGNVDADLPPLLTKKERRKLKEMMSAEEAQTLKQDMKNENKKRQKRQADQNPYGEEENIIELLMTNDVQLFEDFKNWGGKSYSDEEAELNMIEYMMYVASGIDNRMYNIRVKAPDIKIRVHLNAIYSIQKIPIKMRQQYCLPWDINNCPPLKPEVVKIPIKMRQQYCLPWDINNCPPLKPESTDQTYRTVDGVEISWSNHPIDLGDPQPHLDADPALGNFSRFVYHNNYLFSEFDHVMALLGQDLVRWNSDGYWEPAILGYTFSSSNEGVLCREAYYSVSLVEAPALGFPARIGAHELAHNMRAGHDLSGPGECLNENQFIMAKTVQPASEQYQDHPYQFSSCSINKIREHLQELTNMSTDPQNSETSIGCMKHHQLSDVFGSLDGYRLMGQRYDYDIQCKYLMHDPGSRLCVTPRPSYCWHAIYCTWPSVDMEYCYAGYAYNGSPCNSTAICYQGHCLLKDYVLELLSTSTTSGTITTIAQTTHASEKTTLQTQQSTPTSKVSTQQSTPTSKVSTLQTQQSTPTSKVSTLQTQQSTPTSKVSTQQSTPTSKEPTQQKATTPASTPTIKSPTQQKETPPASTSKAQTPANKVLTHQKVTIPSKSNLWSEWSYCSKQCSRKRFRYCQKQEECKGKLFESESCTDGFCMISQNDKKGKKPK